MTSISALGDLARLIRPLDEPNRELLANVRPADRDNPTPREKYDLVVLGAGTAGLVSAAGAAALGARVALVERALMGGDCLNVGCVPSKAILRSARAVGELRKAEALGVSPSGTTVAFATVMRRMRRRRADISPNDSVRRFTELGVDVFFGDGRFDGPRTIVVEGKSLTFVRAVIATGGRPTAPPVPGLAETGYLTNETVFSLTELPRRLLVIGGGPIGCELAQAFARFGSRVTVLDLAPEILPREDKDAAAIVRGRMTADGVAFELGVRLTEVARVETDVRIRFERAGSTAEVTGDLILVAAGRAPNLETLDLRAADVKADTTGVLVSDYLQTSNRRVYAAGDVCSPYKFTHAADAMARIALQNALFFGRKKASALVIPWCTYTDPELAHVGLYEHEAKDRGHRVETITVHLRQIDRAILDEETEGFLRVHHERGCVLGCTIVGPRAGDLISGATYALAHRATLDEFSATVHPYPTLSEAFRHAGDAYRRTRLTPSLRRWLERYFTWTRF